MKAKTARRKRLQTTIRNNAIDAVRVTAFRKGELDGPSVWLDLVQYVDHPPLTQVRLTPRLAGKLASILTIYAAEVL